VVRNSRNLTTEFDMTQSNQGLEPTHTLDSAGQLASHKTIPAMFDEFGAETLLRKRNFPKIIEHGVSSSVSPDARKYAHLQELHEAIDFTRTKLGSAALMCDIMRPPSELHEVQLRREAILELRSHGAFSQALTKALQKTQEVYFMTASMEDNTLRFFVPGGGGELTDTIGALDGLKLMLFALLNSERPLMYRLKALGELLKQFKDLPLPESPLLRQHVSTIQSILSSDESGLLHGRICRTWGSIDCRARVPWWKPAFYSDSSFINVESILLNGFVAISGWATAISVAKEGVREGMIGAGLLFRPALASIQAVASLTRIFKVQFDLPRMLRGRVAAIRNLGEALDAVGKLDALLSLAMLPDRFGADGCFPELVSGDSFFLESEAIHNPILYLQGGSVANDFGCMGGTPLLLTGPNSAGKTTLVTSVFQNQILGSWVAQLQRVRTERL
jgi:hypothetical protein